MKKMRKLLRLLFGRTTFIVLFLLIQIGYFFSIVRWLSEYSLFVYAAFDLLGGLLCIYIINKKDNPSFKLAWIIPVLLVPVFGSLLYLYVELEISGRLIAKRAGQIVRESEGFVKQDRQVLERLAGEDKLVANLAEYVSAKGGFPAYGHTFAEYFPSGQEKWKRLKEELEKARRFIFMEYFIVEEGVMWNSILEILERKAREGVEVRFMYDGMCSLMLLPYNYPKKMEAKGIHCQMFAPIRPFLSTAQNNRDHRKIVVIDGHTAFTGGINLADEYINEKKRFGYWKDVGIMVKGDAVQNFTVMFLQLWNIWERRPLPYDKYLYQGHKEEFQRLSMDGYVLAYGDSPLDHEPVGKRVYMDMLYNARNYVHIMTPYLILDDEMISALTYGAKRGVEIIIIMPHIPDKKYAFVLAHTYYKELLEAGVEIYEFTPGFVHAKVFTSDDEKAVVGTINLDFRSLYHHFECGAFLYRNRAVADVENDFQDTLAKCQRITVQMCNRYPLYEKIAGQALRLIAPMM
ncbi:MAG: cardiolipin synthase [Hungatella sp.]|nr:cardiolipin synthase [Hungatella sp.]